MHTAEHPLPLSHLPVAEHSAEVEAGARRALEQLRAQNHPAATALAAALDDAGRQIQYLHQRLDRITDQRDRLARQNRIWQESG